MRKKPIIGSVINSDLIVAKHISPTLYRHYNININNHLISPCGGCHRSTYTTNASCTITLPQNSIYLISRKIPSLPSTYQLKIAISDIKYLSQSLNNTPTSINEDHTSYNTRFSTTINDQLIQSIFINPTLQNTLSHYANNNADLKSVTFYTDGSISHFGKQNIKLSCAWIQIQNNHIKQSFSCSLKSFPSSTRTELMAILTALITCPKNSSVSVYTDSQSAIQILNTFISLTTQSKFKVKNYSIISSIQHITKILSLKVSYHKIKAHSGNHYNEMADNLAKNPSPEMISINISSINLLFPIIYKQIYIDYPLQSFIKISSHSQIATNWQKQPALRKLIPQNTNINWSYTEFCLDFSHYSMFTNGNSHFYHGTLYSFKLELLHNSLPTIQTLIRNYPTLMPPHLKCLYCNELPENIAHLFSCHSNMALNSIPWTTIIQSISTIIEKWFSLPKSKPIMEELQPLISNLNHNSTVTLAAGLIPSNLVNSTYSILKSHTKTSIILNHISYNLITFYYTRIWIPRCELVSTWLKQHKINLKKKTAIQTYPINQSTQATPSTLPTPDPSIQYHPPHIDNFIHNGSNFLLPR